jgi:hypothetical protein
VGVARSGIPADALEEGRNATITGIVKRAHPSATDQRFGIAPRTSSDIRLGPAPRGGSPSAGEGEVEGDDPDDADAVLGSEDPGAPGLEDAPMGASLSAVPALVGRRVRVAGALRAIDTPLLTLDDGSGRGLVRLLDDDPSFDPPLHLGEVVNVTGTVATRDIGGWEIVARAEGVLRAARLTVSASAPPHVPSDAEPSPSSVEPTTTPELATAPGLETGGPADAGPLRTLLALLLGLGTAALVVLGTWLAIAAYRGRSRPQGHGRASTTPEHEHPPLDAP